jgi:hypothetical protein
MREQRASSGPLYWTGTDYVWEWVIRWEPEPQDVVDEELARSWEEIFPEFAAWLRGEVLTEPELLEPYWEDPRWVARNGLQGSVFDRQVDSYTNPGGE